MTAVAQTVCALVRDGETARRLEAQTRRVDDVLVHDGPVGDRMRAALDREATWFWLLEEGVEPDPTALAELLVPLTADGELPAPVLVASKVLGRDGRLDPRSAPWPRSRGEVVVAACQHRLVVLRLVGWGSLLVHRDALSDHRPPRTDLAEGADALEWTTRLLAASHGYLAPRSVATRWDVWTGRSDEEARDRVRLIFSPSWVGQERLWFAFRVADDAMRDLRSAPRSRTLAALARGVVAGVAGRR